MKEVLKRTNNAGKKISPKKPYDVIKIVGSGSVFKSKRIRKPELT
jgi:hypothetical protein